MVRNNENYPRVEEEVICIVHRQIHEFWTSGVHVLTSEVTQENSWADDSHNVKVRLLFVVRVQSTHVMLVCQTDTKSPGFYFLKLERLLHLLLNFELLSLVCGQLDVGLGTPSHWGIRLDRCVHLNAGALLRIRVWYLIYVVRLFQIHYVNLVQVGCRLYRLLITVRFHWTQIFYGT